MRLVRTAVWLALWGAAGCSTGPDLSSLQFLPEDLQTTDGKTDHVAPPDTTPRDEQEEVALPPAKKCWEAFYCVLTGVFAGTCSPEDLNCYRECAESETWDTDLPELWAVEECFRGCMEGKESDAAWECVGDYCNKDILYCMIPKG